MNREPVGLIGIGLLGSALAGNLLQAGWKVVGTDCDQTRRDEFVDAGGTWVESSTLVAQSCRRIVFCLPDSSVVCQVLEQIEKALQPGAIVIDTTTGDPEITRSWAQRLAEHGIVLLDATILGSSEQVRTGEAMLIVGGPAAEVEAVADIFAVLAPEYRYVGTSGNGQLVKLIANLVLGLNRAALAEGLHLARTCGLDLAVMLDILRSGAAYSRVMDTKGEKMISSNFAPQARLSQHLKDVRLILRTAQRTGTALPLSSTHCHLLERAERLGHGQDDNSAVIRSWSEVGDG